MQPETPIAAYRAARAAADQSFQQNRRPYLYFRRHTAAHTFACSPPAATGAANSTPIPI